ncbi:hypothetical protein P2H44_07520 [Albimonas sp. CAU 1670]|uniref:hypothetical protein n=1 Tax=Albimonas sp. CAU 1670 TaxID=3032599 RepID=UPI0023DAFC2C|nr:hypothetical protein [Albimonas sp. CAU 1670]MDF2232401.1 hypothetical protein [Albimonas sp. CAU 1670]
MTVDIPQFSAALNAERSDGHRLLVAYLLVPYALFPSAKDDEQLEACRLLQAVRALGKLKRMRREARDDGKSKEVKEISTAISACSEFIKDYSEREIILSEIDNIETIIRSKRDALFCAFHLQGALLSLYEYERAGGGDAPVKCGATHVQALARIRLENLGGLKDRDFVSTVWRDYMEGMHIVRALLQEDTASSDKVVETLIDPDHLLESETFRRSVALAANAREGPFRTVGWKKSGAAGRDELEQWDFPVKRSLAGTVPVYPPLEGVELDQLLSREK